MSWRALILFLIVIVFGASVGGIMLGEWLVESSPAVVNRTVTAGAKDPEPVLDADGKPFAAQPPQPLVDGTLGVPKTRTETEWKISETAVVDVQDGALRQLDTVSGLPPGPTDIGTVDVSNTSTSNMPTTGGASTPSPAPPSRPATTPTQPAPSSASWLQSLRKEMGQCDSLGFFQRPTCIQHARNRYCNPNNAWGKVPECPARTFDQPGA